MEAPSGLTLATRNERPESASADFHELRQGFSPLTPDPKGAFKRLLEGLESLKK